MGAVRRWLRIFLLLAWLCLCLSAHLLCHLFRLPSHWPRRFLGGAARCIGVRAHVEGRLVAHDVFFISNHVSWLDILVLGGLTGCAFVSKDDVARWPLIGWLAKQNNTIFINRTDRRALGGQMDALRDAIASHQPVTLFPEGTTGNGRDLLPFKPALLAVLLPPPRDIEIQPVFIDYGARAADIAWHDGEPAGTNMKRILELPGVTPVMVHFLESIDHADHADRKSLSRLAFERISGAQAAFSSGGPMVEAKE